MKYVIIGCGAAGINAAKTIRQLDSHAEILIVSTDEQVYSRCMLHHVIAGKRSEKDISFVKDDFFTANDLDWIKGVKVTDILLDQHQLTLEDQTTVSYDRLLIATGSKASLPPIPGLANARNAFTLRNMEDVNHIIAVAENGKSALVIGAGLVGLDAAAALMERGLRVTIVEMADQILPLQLDRQAALNYQSRYENSGAKVFTGTAVDEVLTDSKGGIRKVRLHNGSDMECDMIIAAAGVKPNIDFIKDKVLTTNGGIAVNKQMRTSVPDIFAAGDVTGESAIWPLAVKQGAIAAYNMVGVSKEANDFFTAKNAINLLGLETVSLGLVNAPDSSYSVDTLNGNGIYKRIIHKNGIVYGIILQNDIAHCGFWSRIIKDKIKISPSLSNIFDLSYADFFRIDEKGIYQYATMA